MQFLLKSKQRFKEIDMVTQIETSKAIITEPDIRGCLKSQKGTMDSVIIFEQNIEFYGSTFS